MFISGYLVFAKFSNTYMHGSMVQLGVECRHQAGIKLIAIAMKRLSLFFSNTGFSGSECRHQLGVKC